MGRLLAALFIMCVKSEGFVKTVGMRSRALAFALLIIDKYHISWADSNKVFCTICW